jgi:hypothetical protein
MAEDASRSVTILGLFKDQISPGVDKVSASTKNLNTVIDASTAKMDAESAVMAESVKINEQLTAEIVKRTQASQKSTTEVTKSASAHDRHDGVSHRLIRRTETLAIRMVALGYAMQGIGEHFGKVNPAAEGFKQMVEGIGLGIAIFPGAMGAAGGAVLGVVTALVKLSKEISEIEEKSKKLIEASNKTQAKVAGKVGRTEAERGLIAGDEAATDALNSTEAKQRYLHTEELKAELEQDYTRKVNELEQVQKKVEELRMRNAAADAKAIRDNTQLGDIGPRTRREEELKKAEEATKKLRLETEQLKTSVDELNQTGLVQLFQLDALEQKAADAKALKTYNAELTKLNGELRANEESEKAGNKTGLQAAEQRLTIEQQILSLKQKNIDLLAGGRVGYNRADQDAEIKAQKDKVALTQQNLDFEKELIMIKKDDAEFTKSANEAEKKQIEERNKQIEGEHKEIASAGADLVTGLIDGLAKGTLNIRQFFGEFLLKIGESIVQALVLKAIMSSLTAVGFNAGGSVQGRNAGGVIYASGGLHVPGPNVNRDVVPAMLTPGEFVMKRAAVDKYGLGAMHAINQGVAQISGHPSAMGKVATAGHYSDGGSADAGAESAPNGAFLPVQVTDEQALERQLHGGAPAFFRFAERHSDTLRGIINKGKRG